MKKNLRPGPAAACAASALLLLAGATARAEDAKPAAPAPAAPAAPVATAPASAPTPAPAKPAASSKKKTSVKPAASAPAPAPAAAPAKAVAPAAAAAPAPAAEKTAPPAAPPAPSPEKAAPAAVVPAPVPGAAAPAPAPATAPAPAAGPAPVAPPPVAKPGTKAAPAKAAAPAVLPTSSAEAEAVWRAYEKRWSETADYAAGFRQVIEVPDIGSKVESAGRFFFAKPGLVRWEYNEGPPQTVVGDGTWIWLYQPDLQQVYKIAYAKAFGRGGLVELLAGREGVSERYTTSLDRPDPTSVRIHLHSKVEGGGDLEVTLAADTFDLRAVTVHDSAGSTTSMTFTEPLRNKGVDRARFTFTPPPAVDIISDNESGF